MNTDELLFIYVDMPVPEGLMHNVLSAGNFGDVKIQKSTLRDTLRQNLGAEWVFQEVLPDALKNVLEGYRGKRVVVWPAHVAILNAAKFKLLLDKFAFAQYPVRVKTGKAVVFSGLAQTYYDVDNHDIVELEFEDYLVALESMSDLQRLFSANIHSRYFNDVVAKGETIIKKSSDRKKIKAEFDFLVSVPEELKPYFVPVRDYVEGESGASYTMPKLPMLDASVRFINGNLRGSALERFMEDSSRYLEAANALKRPATKETFEFIADKCISRLDDLKRWEGWSGLEAFVAAHTDYAGFEEAAKVLQGLLERERKNLLAAGQVFSHGDLCLSNMLYDEGAGLLQLIDPRGGVADTSYRSAYYDLAKLSHSLLGGYDHIINGVASIRFDNDMKAQLALGIEGYEDVRAMFARMVEGRGFPLRLVRLVEASLFFSMLPLHQESSRKVHMLALRGIEILNEVKA